MELVQNPSSRRLFVGIPVIEQECPKFFTWSQNLIKESTEAGWNVRWTNPNNYHITIKFLGDSTDHNTDKIISTIRTKTFSPFWIQIQNMGFFLNGKHSNIVWAGIESKEITMFQSGLHELLKGIGYGRELKPFNPHITLGRMKEFEEIVHGQSISTVLDQFRVTKFCLFESFFSTLRVEYKILETFECK